MRSVVFTSANDDRIDNTYNILICRNGHNLHLAAEGANIVGHGPVINILAVHQAQ
jgi:hypothetical protein